MDSTPVATCLIANVHSILSILMIGIVAIIVLWAPVSDVGSLLP